MDEKLLNRRATVHDVAREAGVSLATVDRVLNGRPGVRAETAARVQAAISALGFRRDLSASLLARARDLNVTFLIPEGANEFMRSLRDAITRRAHAIKGERLMLETRLVKAFDAEALATAIAALPPRSVDCAVIVATDHPTVRKAVEAAGRRGIAVVTLVSDLPGSARRHFVGIDNVAAGRTAASLMGRFCRGGKIGLIAGSLELRDHRERRDGFVAVMRDEFPGLELVGPLEGFDDNVRTAAATRELLALGPALSGIYNLGAGNSGMLAALEASGRARDIHVIAHELSTITTAALDSGVVDVVLDQNPDREIAAAVAAARAVASRHEAEIPSEPIEIGIFLRDNLHQGRPIK